MSQQQQIPINWNEIVKSAGPYPVEALHFVREGLSYTVDHVHHDPDSLTEIERHVTGQQLCFGLREFAIRQYGMMAPLVLHHWRISKTDDFGKLVFAMIDAGLMSKTSNDTLDDFRGVFDFAEAFSPEALRASIASSQTNAG